MADDRSSKNQKFSHGFWPSHCGRSKALPPPWAGALPEGSWRAWHSCLYTIIAKPFRGCGTPTIGRLICNLYRRVFRSNLLLIKKSPSTYTYASSGCGLRRSAGWERSPRNFKSSGRGPGRQLMQVKTGGSPHWDTGHRPDPNQEAADELQDDPAPPGRRSAPHRPATVRSNANGAGGTATRSPLFAPAHAMQTL